MAGLCDNGAHQYFEKPDFIMPELLLKGLWPPGTPSSTPPTSSRRSGSASRIFRLLKWEFCFSSDIMVVCPKFGYPALTLEFKDYALNTAWHAKNIFIRKQKQFPNWQSFHNYLKIFFTYKNLYFVNDEVWVPDLGHTTTLWKLDKTVIF